MSAADTLAGPIADECDTVLTDGGTVHVRSIRPDDGPRLVAFHEGLSADTVYRRYLSPHPHLSAREVERFTHVDRLDRLALVAVDDGVIVAVGRLERLPGTDRAEVAFVVADDHQGRGLGTLLLEHLATAARPLGITGFVADTMFANSAMLGVFRDAGFELRRSVSGGVLSISFPIASTEDYQAAVDRRDQAAQAQSMARILRPHTIAVVGAGRRPGSIGHEILANLVNGGFTGALYPVNPGATEVLGLRCYPSLAEVPGSIDLVVIAVPAPAVADVIEAAGSRHAHAAVVISAGFAETGSAGAAAEGELVAVARRHGMRLIGPNCMGVLNTEPAVRMNATFSPATPVVGRAAFLSQSGALGIAVLERAVNQGLGLSTFVSVGNKADVSGNDLLQYWETDPATDVILLYLESFGNPRKFARLARRVSRTKPIVAMKSGRTRSGNRAARSHTAAASTDDVSVDALFRQAGVIRVDNLAELLDTAALLANQPLPAGPRVAIVGNSGGPGILAADACEAMGLEVPELSTATQALLRAALPVGAAVHNPVDLLATASGSDYEEALRAVAADENVDAIVVVFTPPLVTKADAVAAAVQTIAAEVTTKPILASFLTAEEVRMVPGAVAVPCYTLPEQAIAALGRALCYARWRAAPIGRRPVLSGVDRPEARSVIDGVLQEHRSGAWLSPPYARRLAQSYGINVVPTISVHSASEATDAADAVGYPAVLKASGPSLVHKTEAGGVRLGLQSARDVSDAYVAMAAAVGDAMDGAVVQPMVPAGVETIVGLVQDPSFGPLVMVGLGGVATDLLADRSFRIPPLTDRDADEMVRSLRTAPLLTGYRGSTPTDVAALEDVLVRVAQLGEDHPEVVEIDLNPLIVSPTGVCAVDIKIRVAPTTGVVDPTMRRLR